MLITGKGSSLIAVSGILLCSLWQITSIITYLIWSELLISSRDAA